MKSMKYRRPPVAQSQAKHKLQKLAQAHGPVITIQVPQQRAGK